MATTRNYIEELRQKCLERGASGIKGLGRTFRIMDDNRDWNLNMEEFVKGISDYGLAVSIEDAKEMFKQFDKDGSGTINFDEFLESLRPSMSDSRRNIVDAAFKKFDKTGDGIVTVKDMERVYNPREHPKYQEGTLTEEQVFEEFLKQFDSPNDRDGKVTQEEFVNYYSGVSANIDNDAQFDLTIRNTWKI